MSIESQVRAALAARADEVVVGADDPYERVAGAIEASRRRRRSVAAGALAVGAAVAAVAVAVPLLGHG
jgi:stage V sporulation protein SpoVS